MTGGLVGYLGYDMVRHMERLPDDNPDDLGLPEAILLRPTLFAVFDNVRDELTLAAPVYPNDGMSAEAGLGRRAGPARRGARRAGRPLPHAAPARELAAAARTRLQHHA